MDKYGHPTKKELETIRSWDLAKQPVIDLLEHIRQCWNWADVGFYELSGKRVLKLELHTGGWSGNEDVIDALQETFAFWTLYWEKSTRGGHYYFRID